MHSPITGTHNSEAEPVADTSRSKVRNDWILRQLTRSIKLIHGQGTKVLLAATSDHLPLTSSIKLESHKTAVSPLLGLVVQCGFEVQ